MLACFFSLEWDLACPFHVFVTRMYQVKTACQCRGLHCKGRSCAGITSMTKSLHWFPGCFRCQVRCSALIYKATARAGQTVTCVFSFTCQHYWRRRLLGPQAALTAQAEAHPGWGGGICVIGTPGCSKHLKETRSVLSLDASEERFSSTTHFHHDNDGG